MKKNEIGPLRPLTIIKSKWTKDINIRLETIKFLEENIANIVFDVNLSNNIYIRYIS